MRAPRRGIAAWQLAQCAATTRATSHGKGEAAAGADCPVPPVPLPQVPAPGTPVVSGAPALATTGGELAPEPAVPCEAPDMPGTALCEQPKANPSARSHPADPNDLGCCIFVSSIRARAIGLLRMEYERDPKNDHAALAILRIGG